MAIDKIPFRYDTEALKMAVPIADVIRQYTGTDVSHAERRNINCPSPNHMDRKPSAKIYPHSNSCNCFSCGYNADIIKIVQDNCGLDFREACKQLIEDFGLDEYAYSNKAEWEASRRAIKHSSNQFIDHFPLNRDELEIIGIKHNTSHCHVKETALSNDGFEYTACEYDMKVRTVQDMWREDKKSTEEWMMDMADCMIETLREKIAFENSQTEAYYQKYSHETIVKGLEMLERFRTGIVDGVFPSAQAAMDWIKSKPMFYEFAEETCRLDVREKMIEGMNVQINDIEDVKEKLVQHDARRTRAEQLASKLPKSWLERG
jgi:hypothetical protein